MNQAHIMSLLNSTAYLPQQHIDGVSIALLVRGPKRLNRTAIFGTARVTAITAGKAPAAALKSG